jgi:MscS family membrane protein
MRIENISERSRIRFATNLAIAYGTESEKVRGIIDDIRSHLAATPMVEAETVSVALVALAESWITIEVVAWFQSTSWDEYRPFRQEALFALMTIVEKRGAKLAFPTRTLRVASNGLQQVSEPAAKGKTTPEG